jgi:hypothetical protein
MTTRNFSFSNDRMSVLNNGYAFFTTPIANKCMASLHVGLVLPDVATFQKDDSIFPGYQAPYWGAHNTRVVVGGGSCCDGYLIALNDEGKITKILAIDFNIRRIVPIVYSIPCKKVEGVEDTMLGLLVSGAGCSGTGVRFVDFDRVTPTSTPVVSSKEEVVPYNSWLRGADPLSVADIWERLEKIGIKADKERTAMAVKAFAVF